MLPLQMIKIKAVVMGPVSSCDQIIEHTLKVPEVMVFTKSPEPVAWLKTCCSCRPASTFLQQMSMVYVHSVAGKPGSTSMPQQCCQKLVCNSGGTGCWRQPQLVQELLEFIPADVCNSGLSLRALHKQRVP